MTTYIYQVEIFNHLILVKSTSNYLARKFGVRSAMPGYIGKKLCPQIVIVPGSFSKYKHESRKIRTIFEKYDPNVSMGSLDEAYLDITDFMAQRANSGNK